MCKWQRKPLWPNMGKSKQRMGKGLWFTHSIHITIQKAWRLYFVMRITVKNRTKKRYKRFYSMAFSDWFFLLFFFKHDRLYLGASRCYFFPLSLCFLKFSYMLLEILNWKLNSLKIRLDLHYELWSHQKCLYWVWNSF